MQPESSAQPVRVSQRPEEEEDGDLNKALGVQRFQQILNPTPRVPSEQHRVYNEKDFECEFIGENMLRPKVKERDLFSLLRLKFECCVFYSLAVYKLYPSMLQQTCK